MGLAAGAGATSGAGEIAAGGVGFFCTPGIGAGAGGGGVNGTGDGTGAGTGAGFDGGTAAISGAGAGAKGGDAFARVELVAGA